MVRWPGSYAYPYAEGTLLLDATVSYHDANYFCAQNVSAVLVI